MTWGIFSFLCRRKIPWFDYETNHLGPNSRHIFFRICLVSNSRRTFFDPMIHIKSFFYEPKAQFFSNLFSFKPQEHLFLLNLHRWVTNFVLLSLKLQVTHNFDLDNIIEVWTPFSLFLRHAPRYLPRLKSFDFVSQIGPSPFVRSILIPRLTLWVFKNPLYMMEFDSKKATNLMPVVPCLSRIPLNKGRKTESLYGDNRYGMLCSRYVPWPPPHRLAQCIQLCSSLSRYFPLPPNH